MINILQLLLIYLLQLVLVCIALNMDTNGYKINQKISILVKDANYCDDACNIFEEILLIEDLDPRPRPCKDWIHIKENNDTYETKLKREECLNLIIERFIDKKVENKITMKVEERTIGKYYNIQQCNCTYF